MDDRPVEGTLTRRRFMALGGLGTAAGLLLPARLALRAAAQGDGVPIGGGHVIRPRDVWGTDLPPAGPMTPEEPGDVRFLLVHHSASPNDYSPDQSLRYLRSFYHYHTSDEKGWPDIAYNFLVDRQGQIFEGRQGSIESPVRGDATGGSQGFALLACFIGDHRAVAPTEAAQSAMVALLAWLANGYDIDPSLGATTEFVSRGSNLHPEGTVVVTPTITGHRTMSRTTCPGDQAFALVKHSFPQRVSDTLSGVRPASPAPTPVSTTHTAEATTSTTSRAEATTSTTSATAQTPTTPVTTIDTPVDRGTVAVASPAPTVSATTRTQEPPPPTFAPPPAEAAIGQMESGSPIQVSPGSGSQSSQSGELAKKVWAGIGTALLGGSLWLRRRLDPTRQDLPEP